MSRIKDALDYWFDHNVNIATRTILIEDSDGDDIDAKTVARFIKGLHILEQKPDEPINVTIMSFGGSWYEGLAIYDAIVDSPCDIIMKGTGPVMSMGSIIFMAADERILTKNSRLMLHYGTTGIDNAHPKVFESWAEDEKKNLVIMEEIYLDVIRKKYPKFSRKKLQEMLNFDTVLSAQEAVKLGLADKIEGVIE